MNTANLPHWAKIHRSIFFGGWTGVLVSVILNPTIPEWIIAAFVLSWLVYGILFVIALFQHDRESLAMDGESSTS